MIYIGTISLQANSRVSFRDYTISLFGGTSNTTYSPFRTVCTINKTDFNNYIKPAYINYKKNNYDLYITKEILKNYIRTYYKNNNLDLPINPNYYKLNKINNMLKINVINNCDITFYVCIKTRQLYYI